MIVSSDESVDSTGKDNYAFDRQTDRQTDRQRIAWIDIAKGIAIILVVIGHCIPDAASSTGISVTEYRWLHNIIYSFHMPLFSSCLVTRWFARIW